MSGLIVQNVAMFFFLHAGAPWIITAVILPIIFFIIRQWLQTRSGSDTVGRHHRDGR